MSRLRDESGVVGGLEVLPFGVLVFVVGTLIVANGWAVIDAKLAASAAAREAARTFVESDAGTASEAWGEAQRAAHEALTGHGRSPARADVHPLGPLRLERCFRATVEVSYRVAAVVVPWVGGFGDGFTASARHSEIVDPYRDGVPRQPGTDGVVCDAGS